ncbi:FAD-binding oxidoreductase [Pararhodobacter sp. CCB-MM2]|uniref:NAD(P)/FAD-dependent oxidoreductase n=1 Tax=Pararhodobacter sp. CCB-MM2 TaxID=1786003 RepID=UPI0008331AB0|nr:FAD-dependent oxidoreductase [Pararhodobacter sp. CCB-MM2]
MRVAVIGAGILGASVAWHLRRGGASVTVFDAGGTQATPGSFAWINASWGNDPIYRALRLASMELWPTLAAAVPGTGYRRCGGLMWDLPEADLRAFAAEAEDYGRLVTGAEASTLEPGLVAPPELAFHAPGEAQLEPQPAAKAMAGPVTEGRVALDETRGRPEVLIDGGREAFDAVVLAAGEGVNALLAPLGLQVEMSAPPGLLAWSQPVAPLLNGLVMAPELHLRQTAEGRIVVGEDFGGCDPGAEAEASAQLLFRQASTLLGRELTLERYTVAKRPTPGDGRPAVGALPLPGFYLALSHSGVTLAPAIGAMLADEVLNGWRDLLIAPYAPERLIYSV